MLLNDRMIENLNHVIYMQDLRKGDLADSAGITRVQLSRIIHGKSKTTIDTCEALATAIGLPADSLFMTPSRFQKMLSEILSPVA